MSRSRRNFSAEFKTNLVLQLLKGEKELNVLAVENDIQPNLLRNWKKEFLTNASLAFDNKREDNLREKLAEERKEKAEYAKKVGQLTMQVDWLKKNLKKLSDLTTRVNLVRNLSTTKELPVSTGAKLLGINRTSVYYGGIPVSEEEPECKAIIDHLHTDNPTWGARQMSAQLKLRGYQAGRRRAGRYMREEEAYLTENANLKEAREAIGRYIYTYNFERCHQSIGNKRPAEVYYPAMLLDAARAAA